MGAWGPLELWSSWLDWWSASGWSGFWPLEWPCPTLGKGTEATNRTTCLNIQCLNDKGIYRSTENTSVIIFTIKQSSHFSSTHDTLGFEMRLFFSSIKMYTAVISQIVNPAVSWLLIVIVLFYFFDLLAVCDSLSNLCLSILNATGCVKSQLIYLRFSSQAQIWTQEFVCLIRVHAQPRAIW